MRQIYDKKIVDAVQDAYLVIWDWTGISVGMLMMVNGLIMLSLWPADEKFGFMFFFGASLCLVVSSWFHNVQHANPAMFNAYAEFNRTFSFRYFLVVLSLYFCMVGAVHGDTAKVAKEIFLLVNTYLFTVKTRKREPPETGFHRLAHGGTQ